ncbi:MAG: MerR family transcriptional regulator [Chloroflexi bacterium]|jgi:DNA-binding transcriptional MerR regulator|nr:MerR family transcriptional regulator [Chloroflexota bacterium]
MPDGTYSLADLCDLADVTPRTVRYYISQGLLRSPGTSGPGARYDDGHLARLRLVRRLQREHLPLAEIRARLAALSDEEAIAEAGGPVEPPVDSALEYVRGVLGSRTLRTPPGAAAPAPPAPASTAAPAVSESRPPASPPPTAGPAASPVLLRRVERLERVDDVGAAPDEAAPDEAAPAPAAPDEAAPAAPVITEPPGAERSQWERFVLTPDVELHVRRPLTRSQNRAVARLLEAARQLLEEDQP